MVAVLAIVALVAPAPRAEAASVFTVTTTFDAGPGSLRQAVLDANANPGLDVVQILLGPAYVINLSSGITSTDTLVVLGNNITLTLEGTPGPIWNHTGGSTLSVQNLRFVGTQPGVSALSSDGPVQISGCSFSDLSAPRGGAISAASVNVSSSLFANNTAQGQSPGGGAIFASGTVTVTRSTFTGNQALDFTSGGAIATFGDVFVGESFFLANEAVGGRGGGAIISDNGSRVLVSGSTFLSNVIDSAGGGGGSAIIANGDGQVVTIVNSTFGNNIARNGVPGMGTAAIDVPLGSVSLTYTTFLGNSGPAPVDVLTPVLTSFATVFAGATPDHCLVSSSAVSQGYNAEESGT